MADDDWEDEPVDLAEVVKKVEDAVKGGWQSVYLAYDDRLTDKQLEMLAQGWLDKLDEDVYEWSWECYHEAVKSWLQFHLTSEEREALDASDEHYEEVMEILQDADTSDALTELAKYTDTVWLLYDLEPGTGYHLVPGPDSDLTTEELTSGSAQLLFAMSVTDLLKAWEAVCWREEERWLRLEDVWVAYDYSIYKATGSIVVPLAGLTADVGPNSVHGDFCISPDDAEATVVTIEGVVADLRHLAGL